MRYSKVKWTFEIKKFIQTSSNNLSQTNRLLLQMKVDTETKKNDEKSISFGNIVLHKAVFLTLYCLIQCLVRGHDKDN